MIDLLLVWILGVLQNPNRFLRKRKSNSYKNKGGFHARCNTPLSSTSVSDSDESSDLEYDDMSNL